MICNQVGYFVLFVESLYSFASFLALFAFKEITQETDGVVYEIPDIDELTAQLPNSTAHINIKPVKDTRVLDASELTHMSPALDEIDHSLQQYLELETSQTALMNPRDHITYPGGKSFLMHPEEHGFNERDVPSLGHSKFLGIGCQKSIRYVLHFVIVMHVCSKHNKLDYFS